LDEHEALTRLKQGDIAGLAVLVRNHQVKATRTAYLITQDHALAEDVVQSTYLKIYQHIDRYDTDMPFEPWFLRSVVNAAIIATRSYWRQLSLDDYVPWLEGETFADLLPDPGPNPHETLEEAEFERVVREALQKLPPEQRAVVVQRYFLGMSESEMAAEAEVPPGTIKWRLHTARKTLRGLLAGEES
jgi:RNA polymerase sigma-70 factor, ECF subfamily